MTHPFPPSESTETVYLLKTQTPTQTHANLTQTYANLYANLNLGVNPTQAYGNLYTNLRKPLAWGLMWIISVHKIRIGYE